MTAFRDATWRLVAETERRVLELQRRFSSGEIDRRSFEAATAIVIARARQRGVTLADLALTADIIRHGGRLEAPLAIEAPDSDLDRLQTSIATVLDEDIASVETPEDLMASQRLRLGRLARDSTAEAAVFGMTTAMVQRSVPGWVRETDPDPCPVCRGLADGVVRSPRVVMKRHAGCACVQRPVF